MTVLSYKNPDLRTSRKWPFRLFLSGVAFVGLLVLTMSVPIRTVSSRMDTVTGTMRWQTTWPLGISFGPSFRVSPLELRLKTMGVPWKPAWHFMHDTEHALLGGPTYYCGSTPPIFHLWQQEFVDASTDQQVLDFVHVMERGTDDEQTAAVDAALQRIDAQAHGPK